MLSIPLLLLAGSLDELQTWLITLPGAADEAWLPSPISAHPAQMLQNSALADEGTACAGVSISAQLMALPETNNHCSLTGTFSSTS